MDEAVIKRTLPHSLIAEQSVIGSMLIDNETITTANELLTADDFYQHQYGQIFDAIVSLHESGQSNGKLPVFFQNNLFVSRQDK